MLEYIENNFAVGFALFFVNLLVWSIFAVWLLEKKEEAKRLKSLRNNHGGDEA